ncbi:MAG: FkbM family methyltransferase [Bacteroidetes bacterium]|nr:FkbM family methyltransferase [Bdellovibrionales bacterium]NOG56463.1 FkbM family methyltransferase [Bacteroidota bacterium]
MSLYVKIFAKPSFIKWNRFLYHASLKGMGVLNYKNDKESGEEAFLEKTLKGLNAPVVFDVGANVGRYSKNILKINSSAKLHSFEPHPSTFQKLSETMKGLASNLNNKGVGKEKASLKLFDYQDQDGSSHASIYKGVIEEIHNKKAVSHEVDVISLESYLKEQQISNIDLLKIDTEGNELNVLLGLGSFLKEGKVEVIHFEFNEMNIFSKTSFKDFWDLLKNYNIFRLLPNGRMLKINEYVGVDCEIYAYQNIIAIKRK